MKKNLYKTAAILKMNIVLYYNLKAVDFDHKDPL